MRRSHELFVRAQQRIPGGVNSPVRAFRAVGGEPVFFDRGEGPYLIDVDGQRYIDYVGGWGPLIVGHAHPQVIRAVQETAQKGLGFGAPTVLETAMAEKICTLMPSIEKVRMVNSGTEATMSAIRLARGFTAREKIVKFEGCYHGHVDALLVKAGSGALTLGVPTSPGVPEAIAKATITLAYNEQQQVQDAFARYGDEIAAIIVEPVAGNMNCVLPRPGFLECLREVCDQYGSLLIFDEVMTGFRVAIDGAQGLYGVRPDLTTLGKVVGGGLPVGAFGGRADILDRVAPSGPIYQAGTLSGNPVAMAAGLATLEIVEQKGFHASLSQTTSQLVDGILGRARAAGISMRANRVGGMFGLFFGATTQVQTYAQVMASSQSLFQRFFQGMLNKGIYLAPSPFEAGFVSSAHTTTELQQTWDAAEQVLSALSTD